MSNIRSYNTKVIKTKEYVDCTSITVQVNRKDKDMIKISEIKKLTEKLIKDNKGARIMVRALGISHMTTVGEGVFLTLKGLNERLRLDEYEDYFEGRVADTAKFMNFSQLELTIIKPF